MSLIPDLHQAVTVSKANSQKLYVVNADDEYKPPIKRGIITFRYQPNDCLLYRLWSLCLPFLFSPFSSTASLPYPQGPFKTYFAS